MWSIMNSYYFQTHGLGKVKGTKVIEAFGLSYAYYVPGLLRADRVTLGSQNCNLQMHLLEVSF